MSERERERERERDRQREREGNGFNKERGRWIKEREGVKEIEK